MFFILEPEVAGGLGERSVVDASTDPPRVAKLHYIMDGWLGDDILESFPCYIVSDTIRDSVEQAQLSGCTFDTADVTTSEQFQELNPGRVVPKFHWLQVTGQGGIEDFGCANDHRLVVSRRALRVMQQAGQLDHCEIAKYR